MNIKLYTDKDLDGVGCAVLIELIEGNIKNNKVDTEFIDRTKVDSIVLNFLQNGGEHEKYDGMIITDMGVSLKTAQIMDDYFRNIVDMEFFYLLLIDHHEQNLELNKFDWASVIDIDEIKQSATNLVLHHYVPIIPSDVLNNLPHKLFKFVELVTKYDSWAWYTENNIEAYKLHLACGLFGLRHFTDYIKTNIMNKKDLLDLTINTIVENKLKQEKFYIDNKLKTIYKTLIHGFVAGVIYIDGFSEYNSILGNRMCELNQDIDIAFMINLSNSTVELRSIKTDLHLGKWAKRHFNGGGHDKAAGFPLPITVLGDNFLNISLNHMVAHINKLVINKK